MARPRTVTDEAILDAANRVLQRGGPSAVTLASVGMEAGLAPATLVQRYGTKDALMRATLLRAWDGLDRATAEADSRFPLSVDGAVAMLVALSGDYGGHEEYAEGLLLLWEDMRDPVLRARGEQWGRDLARALGRRLSREAEHQELFGRLMAGAWQGSLLWWGFSREGSIAGFVERELRDWCAVVLAGREPR